MNQQNIKVDLLKLFFAYQTNLKLFHFQTSSYAAHKASDKLYKQFSNLSDNFIETYQGKYGPIKETEFSLVVKTFSRKEFVTYTLGFLLLLNKHLLNPKGLLCPKKDSDLITILDEIKAVINRFLYLLGLR